MNTLLPVAVLGGPRGPLAPGPRKLKASAFKRFNFFCGCRSVMSMFGGPPHRSPHTPKSGIACFVYNGCYLEVISFTQRGFTIPAHARVLYRSHHDIEIFNDCRQFFQTIPISYTDNKTPFLRSAAGRVFTA